MITERLEARRSISEAEICAHPGTRTIEVFVSRAIRSAEAELDAKEALPGWLRFARARQGTE